jgi:hypothetical protein
MTLAIGGNIKHGISYVVAYNTDDAYERVRGFLDREDLGFGHERELEKIELMASEGRYNDTGHLLFVNDQ